MSDGGKRTIECDAAACTASQPLAAEPERALHVINAAATTSDRLHHQGRGVISEGGEAGAAVADHTDGPTICCAGGALHAQHGVAFHQAQASAATADGLHDHHWRCDSCGGNGPLDIHQEGLLNRFHQAGAHWASHGIEQAAAAVNAEITAAVAAAEDGIALAISREAATTAHALHHDAGADRTRGLQQAIQHHADGATAASAQGCCSQRGGAETVD